MKKLLPFLLPEPLFSSYKLNLRNQIGDRMQVYHFTVKWNFESKSNPELRVSLPPGYGMPPLKINQSPPRSPLLTQPGLRAQITPIATATVSCSSISINSSRPVR